MICLFELLDGELSGQWRMYAESQFKLWFWLDRYNQRGYLEWETKQQNE